MPVVHLVVTSSTLCHSKPVTNSPTKRSSSPLAKVEWERSIGRAMESSAGTWRSRSARRVRPGRRTTETIPARGESPRIAEPPEHRRDLRPGAIGGHALSRSRAGSWRDSGGADLTRTDSCKRGSGNRHQDRRSAGGSPPTWHRPSRSETRERQAHAGRQSQGARLWSRDGDARRNGERHGRRRSTHLSSSDAIWENRWYRALHESGADSRARGRRANGCLGVRLCTLRNAVGPGRLCWEGRRRTRWRRFSQKIRTGSAFLPPHRSASVSSSSVVCAKTQTRRQHCIGDVVLELEEVRENRDEVELVLSKHDRFYRRALWVMAALGAIAVGLWLSVGVERDARALSPTPITADVGFESHPTLSPDGEAVAFVGGALLGSHIFVTLVGEESVVQLTQDMPNAWFPSWSPNGRLSAFAARVRGVQTRPACTSSPGSEAKRAR